MIHAHKNAIEWMIKPAPKPSRTAVASPYIKSVIGASNAV